MTTEPRAAVASRRRFERLSMGGKAVLSELDESGSPAASWPVSVVDISCGGLGVRSGRAVHIGRRVVIEVLDKAGERVRVLFALARQCRAVDDAYAVGLEFERFTVEPALSKYLEDWRERVAGAPSPS